MRTTTSRLVMLAAAAGALTMAAVPATAGKKPGGTTPDPCLNMNQAPAVFPSHVFTRTTGTLDKGYPVWGIYIADSTGKCQVLVQTYMGGSYGLTLNLRVQGSSGLILGDGPGFGSVVASSISITYATNGVPTVESTAFEEFLSLADMPSPVSTTPGWESPAGFAIESMGTPQLSPDGSAVLIDAYGSDGAVRGGVKWLCQFDGSPGAISASGCEAVLYSDHANGWYMSGGWSPGGGAVYFTYESNGGSSGAVYRLDLRDRTVATVWNQGTPFRHVSAGRVDGHELLAVSETAPNGLGCNTVYVIDAGQCSNGSCTVLNGAGHKARWGTWLPNGQVVAEGQTSPSKRGGCAANGTIVSFDHWDTNNTITTLSQGYQPNGAD